MKTETLLSRRTFAFRAAATALLVAGGLVQAPAFSADQAAVSVVTIVDHPALDAFRDGVQKALKAGGYEQGKNLKWTFQSAQGNAATVAQIARKFVGEQPDAIVAISTPAAQAVVAATRSIPVVFGAVTDPVQAQLVKSMQSSGSNVTGVSDRLVPEPQVELIRKLKPDVKRVGMVYNPAEANSVVAVREMKAALAANGIELVEAAAPRTVDVGQAARRLVGKVDLIYTGTDNNVVSAYEALAKVGNDAQIPLVAADAGSVPRGAAAALSVDYALLGEQAGRQVIAILKGRKPADLPSETAERQMLVLNAAAARKQGIEFSDALKAEAAEILGQ